MNKLYKLAVAIAIVLLGLFVWGIVRNTKVKHVDLTPVAPIVSPIPVYPCTDGKCA